MSNAKRLLANTIMLTASSFLMRTVSVSFNVYLTNIIGAEGIGLFQLVSTVYAMAITFSVAGIRLASMRLVADSLALGRQNQRQIMSRCLFYGAFCGVAMGFLLTASSDLIATKWIENESAISSLKILSISLPFVSMSASLNGYFTSEGKIMRYTSVQLFEQLFKIGITVFFIGKISNGNSEDFCKAIVIGISFAEIFSLLSSYSVYCFTSRKEKEKSSNKVWKNLFRIALPDAIGSEMRSVLTTVEHILIPKGLKKAGGSVDNAIATYGIVHGMTLPIILYPSALISSLSGLLVPEISAHYVSGQYKRIHYIIRRVLHLTLLFAIGTAGIMFFNAQRLSFAFYGNSDCGFYIKILAPLVVVMYMDTSVDGMLKGLDQQMSYMKYNIIDAGSCVALVYFLVPLMGVKGYILVIYLSELINFVLSFRRLTVVSEVTIELFKDLVVPLLGIITSCLCGEFFGKIFSFNLNFKTNAIFYVLIEIIIYFSVLRLFRAIDKEEMQWLKRLIFRKDFTK
ncbi:MAG: oligosaccharide flippase family protein [Clostridia bacterium]|nr:oligosaccharide flippase family protein [Clostridia bacterium]